jgi:hypothetical protein
LQNASLASSTFGLVQLPPEQRPDAHMLFALHPLMYGSPIWQEPGPPPNEGFAQ